MRNIDVKWLPRTWKAIQNRVFKSKLKWEYGLRREIEEGEVGEWTQH